MLKKELIKKMSMECDQAVKSECERQRRNKQIININNNLKEIKKKIKTKKI